MKVIISASNRAVQRVPRVKLKEALVLSSLLTDDFVRGNNSLILNHILSFFLALRVMKAAI